MTMSIILLLIALSQLVFLISLKTTSDFDDYKPVKFQDINITALDDITFINDTSRPQYSPYDSHLGFTGRLFLNCYSGTCKRTVVEHGYTYYCDVDDYCYTEYEDYEVEKYEIIYNCSFQCFEDKKSQCDVCPSKYDTNNGTCKLKTDDIYNKEKYCYGDNIIYFWKGKKYVSNMTYYTYLNNVKLKNEECPQNTKNCGVIDDNENELCISNDLKCPINTISDDTQLNYSIYSSFEINNKTFYFGFDKDFKGKLLSGLYVDTDIYLDLEEEYFTELDTYTISGLLKENYLLYRGVDLGYDPYNSIDIDNRGKSHLKIKYNSNNLDLVSLRNKVKEYNKRIELKDKVIDPFKKYLKVYFVCGIIANIYLFIFICCLISIIKERVRSGWYLIRFSNCVYIVGAFPFFVLSIVNLIYALINFAKLNKSNEIVGHSVFNFTKIMNILFFSFVIASFLLLILICIYINIKRRLVKKEKKVELENTKRDINNITTNSKNNVADTSTNNAQ